MIESIGIKSQKTKVRLALSEIERLAGSDFPYAGSKDALGAIRDLFEKHLLRLNNLDESSDRRISEQLFKEINIHLSIFLPVLGLILRSTNVRNAFEFYAPLKSLLKQLIGDDANLVLSSEWEYSPFTYPPVIPELPNYVLIGLPAPESANALIIPAAGHEIGHSIWVKIDLEQKLKTKITKNIVNEIIDNWQDYLKYHPRIEKDKIDDLIGQLTWRICYEWVIQQIEEIFCDFVGLRIFGESYLFAFAYLLAPSLGGRRNPNYPTMADRVEHLCDAANDLNVTLPDNYAARFEGEDKAILTPPEEFFLDIADSVSRNTVPDIWAEAKSYCDDRNVVCPDVKQIGGISDDFRLLLPSSGGRQFVDIINAGWKCHLNEEMWEGIGVNSVRSRIILNELILKSIEVAEFEIEGK